MNPTQSSLAFMPYPGLTTRVENKKSERNVCTKHMSILREVNGIRKKGVPSVSHSDLISSTTSSLQAAYHACSRTGCLLPS
jgi:hypothetical protein